MLSMRGRSIEVLVGPAPPVLFIVHEHLVCSGSAFFKAAMNHGWSEASQRSIRFEVDEPDAFDAYLHWLYYGTIPSQVDENGSAEFLMLSQAYVLGDRIQDGDFCDAVVDAIIDKCNTLTADNTYMFPTCRESSSIYAHTTGSAKIRALLVDLYGKEGDESWMPAGEEDIPKSFLFNLTKLTLYEARNAFWTQDHLTWVIPCAYHQHGPDPATCYRNRSRKRQLEKETEGEPDLQILGGTSRKAPAKRAKRN
jgi:hypothetical protein